MTTSKDESQTLDETQDAFEFNPCNRTAGAYLRELIQYSADDMIGEDTLLNGLIRVRDYLATEIKAP